MTDDPAIQIDQALFEAASEIRDPEARRMFLMKACGGDEGQLARIQWWLGAIDAADEFFSVAALARVDASDPESGIFEHESTVPGKTEIGTGPPADGPGSRIGRYRLIERIGEGGCGTVYRAEQLEPVRREVALKVIRLGLDTERVIARFEMERQSLALMSHPHIARVLDAGTTDRGRPYFVMELVHGVRFTQHCDDQRLGLRKRLELFIQVCGAIQHAHQKGVIHRDIKPSNILVSSQDGLAIPKVIDFGIARAVEGRLVDGSEFTACEQFIGTPAYMSPEQAAGGRDADTRSDVYSLGVLLHELLTGLTPFDDKRLAQASLFEVLRILREEEPPAPLVILSKLRPDELAAVADSRGTDPAHLVASMKGDLNWIILKAMAKDRRDRYDTVNGLALDIQRFLDDVPILARPPSRFYLFGKFVRRNKITFAMSAVVIAVLVAGLTGSSWFYLREREARQEQEKLRGLAEFANATATRLLQQSKARESVSQAAILLSEGKIEAADALLVKTPLNSIEPSLEAATVFRSLGDWNAIRQRWKQAAECYNLFLQANRLDRTPDLQFGLLNLIAVGPTLVLAGDSAGYNRFREETILRYGKTTDPINAAILLKACLLGPADASLLERLRPFADLHARILSNDGHEGIDPYQSAFLAMGLGLMEYRRGNFPMALEWSRRSQVFPDENQARSATAHAIASMAAHHLGQVDLARAELAQSNAIFAGPFDRDAYYPRGIGQGHWQDWAIARVLQREAAALIEAAAPASR